MNAKNRHNYVLIHLYCQYVAIAHKLTVYIGLIVVTLWT